MVHDDVTRQSPDGGVPDAPGLGVDVDEERLQEAAATRGTDSSSRSSSTRCPCAGRREGRARVTTRSRSPSGRQLHEGRGPRSDLITRHNPKPEHECFDNESHADHDIPAEPDANEAGNNSPKLQADESHQGGDGAE